MSFRASDHTGVGISKYSLLYEIATPQKRLAMTYIVLDVTRYYKGKTGFTCFYISWIRQNAPPRIPLRVKIRGNKKLSIVNSYMRAWWGAMGALPVADKAT